MGTSRACKRMYVGVAALRSNFYNSTAEQNKNYERRRRMSMVLRGGNSSTFTHMLDFCKSPKYPVHQSNSLTRLSFSRRKKSIGMLIHLHIR